MSEKMTNEKALEYFGGGLDCSQVVFEHGAKRLGFHGDNALKISAAFGGGMWLGETCGCVTGALMALGLKYGHCKLGDEEGKNTMLAKKAEFEKRFLEENESLICKKILGYDISDPEEVVKLQESGLLTDKCPGIACGACKILDEML